MASRDSLDSPHASQTASVLASKKRSSRRSHLVWGGLGLLLLVTGAALTAYHFLRQPEFPGSQDASGGQVRAFLQEFSGGTDEDDPNRGDSFFTTPLTSPQDADQATSSATSRRAFLQGTPAATEPATAYALKANENLWRIVHEGRLQASPTQWPQVMFLNADSILQATYTAEADWQVSLPVGAVIAGGLTGLDLDPGVRRYVVQLASVESRRLAQAERLLEALARRGIFAYRTEMQDASGQVHHRIRSGFYESREEAEAIMQAATRHFKDVRSPWIFAARQDEQQGQNLAGGAQLLRPFVIEFPPRILHQQAQDDLKRVGRVRGRLVYVSQNRPNAGSPFQYQVRIGYFAKESEAMALIQVRVQVRASEEQVSPSAEEVGGAGGDAVTAERGRSFWDQAHLRYLAEVSAEPNGGLAAFRELRPGQRFF